MMSLVLEDQANTEQVRTGALNGGEYSQSIAIAVKVEKWIIENYRSLQ